MSQNIELDTELIDEFCLENEKFVRADDQITHGQVIVESPCTADRGLRAR